MREEMQWDWAAMLGRPLATPDMGALREAVGARRVLITGAGGSIGSVLAASVLRAGADSLILCDSSEHALYEIYRQLAALPEAQRIRIVASIGDALQPNRLRHTFNAHHPDLIFHAAAYKHVPLLESNPFAALANNAVGTMCLVREVLQHGNCQLILLSTDKAVQPESVMGVSKRLAEMAVLSHAGTGAAMCAVRLCNVLGSSGSVVPLFAEQLERNIALTVTHVEARRCFLTASEAATALLTAAGARLSGKVLVPDCGDPLRILDLARHMAGQYRTAHGEQVEEAAKVRIVGLRAGEKLVEAMVSATEVFEQRLASGLRVFTSPCPTAAVVASTIDLIEQAIESFDSAAMLAAVAELVPADRVSVEAVEG